MPRNSHEIPLWKKVAAGTAAALGTSGLFLTTGCSTEQAPPAATATQTGETATNNEQENWADYAATVDKYPTVEEAAAYLMGGSDGTGLYSKIIAGAGRRGESTSNPTGAPAEAIVALFGPEPTGGYPANVVGMISQLNKDYNSIALTYITGKDMGPPLTCTTTFTGVKTVSGNTVNGTMAMNCINAALMKGSKDGKWGWGAGLTLTLKQQNNDGRSEWVIVDGIDGQTS